MDQKDLLARNRQLEKENQELKRREELLRKLALAVEHSPISVMITNRAGVLEYVNPKFCEVTGYTPEEVLGRKPSILKSGTHPEGYYREMWDTILAGREWRGELNNRNKDGGLLWELASISPVFDAAGNITHFVGVKEDITELKRLQTKLGEMAHSDELTGLPNRALFLDRLNQAISHAHRNLGRFALLFLDLDGFKKVNDRYGHQVGDLVLKEAARRLVACVRDTDTVARVGGDEFTIILEDLRHWEEPAVVARKLVERFSIPFDTGDSKSTVGVSIGASIYPDDAYDADQLIACADSAMYAAKEAGKNGYRYWSQCARRVAGGRTD